MARKLEISRQDALVEQGRVLKAVILRDIRTRFFGHGLGYLIAIGWPLAHILVLLVIYTVTGRTTPYGSNLSLFFATGLVPFMAFQYSARFIMLSLMVNRPLLNLPAVKVTDLLAARACLEALAACCTAVIVLATFYVFDVDASPREVVPAFEAFGLALLLGIGFGSVNAVLAVAIPGWTLGYILLQIIMYMTSGVATVSADMPLALAYAFSFNPAFHIVEWMRESYFEGYQSPYLDVSYLMAWAIGSLCIGLMLERAVRGRILGG